MQTKRMSLANITGKLSRAEMKNIMAGSGCKAAGEFCDGSAVPAQCCNTCHIVTEGPNRGKEICT